MVVQKQSDACLRRFLRAFGTADDAFIMLVKCIKWRREFGVESLSESDPDIKTEVETGKAQLLRHRDFSGRLLAWNAHDVCCDISLLAASKFLEDFVGTKLGLSFFGITVNANTLKAVIVARCKCQRDLCSSKL